MTKKMRKALERSIAHWKRLRDGKRKKMLSYHSGQYELEDIGAQFCSLCVASGYD